MSDVLQSITNLPTPFNMIVLIVLIGALSGIFTSIVKHLGAYAQRRQELGFKRELLDRGMSAEEVQRVVESRIQSASPKIHRG